MSELKVDKVIANEVHVVSPNGKFSVTLKADDKVAGIWLGKKGEKSYLGLVFDEVSGCPYFVVSRTNDKEIPDFVITVGEDGKVNYQERVGEENTVK